MIRYRQLINKTTSVLLILLIVCSYFLPFVKASTRKKLHVDVTTDDNILVGFASSKADGKSIGNGLYRDFALPYEQYKVYDKIAYCVQPLVKSGTDEAEILDYNETIEVLGKERVDVLWKWAFFGIGYNGDYSKERAVATQMYFWSINGLFDLKNSNKHNNKDNKLLYEATHKGRVNITPEKNGLWKTYPIHTKDNSFKEKVYKKYAEIEELVKNFNISKPNMTYGEMLKKQPNLHKDFMFKFAKFKNKQDLLLIGFHPDLPLEMKLRITKKDSNTKNIIPIKDTEFKIYNADTNEAIHTVKTNEKGIGVSNYLFKIGKYYIKEIKAPTGYVLSNKKHYFEIKEQDFNRDIYSINLNGEDIKVLDYEIENIPQTGTLQINKYGEELVSWEKQEKEILVEKDPKILKETDIEILKNKDVNISKTIIRGSNGISSNNSSSNNTKNETTEYIKTKTDDKGQINESYGRLLDLKYEEKVISKIPGILKKIDKENSKSKDIDTYTYKDADILKLAANIQKDILNKRISVNTLSSTEREMLKYFLENILLTKKITYKVLDDKSNVLYVYNVDIDKMLTEKLNVIKKSGINVLNILEETISVYREKDKISFKMPNKVKEYDKYVKGGTEKKKITVSTPKYEKKRLDDCIFYILADRDIYSNDKQQIIFKKNERIRFAKNDIYIGNNLIYKKNEVIGGKTYIFKDKSETEIAELKKILKESSTNTFKTSREKDKNILFGFPLGRYLMYEEKAKNGYIPMDTIRVLEFLHNDQTIAADYVSTKEILNKRINQHIKIDKKKFESEFKTEFNINELNKVHFGIYNKEEIMGLKKDSLIDIASPNNNGELTFKNLPSGKYYIKELYTLKNYVLDEKLYDVEIKKIDENYTKYGDSIYRNKNDKSYNMDNKYSFDIVNKLKRGSLELLKVDENSNKGIANVFFKLYRLDENNKEEEILKENPLKTDENGKLIIPNLIYGNYVLKEIMSATGYVLDNLILKYAIYDTNQPTKIVAKNSKTHIGIEKVSSLTNKHIIGATFVLKDSNNNIIDKWNTDKGVDENGIHHIYGLDSNMKYYLSEVITPSSIDKDTAITNKEVIVRNIKGMQHILLKNTENSIKIVKIDKYSKQKLYDVEFNIYDDKGNLFKDVYGNSTFYISKEDIDGKRIYGFLNDRTYYIKETKAPSGYILNDNYTSFNIGISNRKNKGTNNKNENIVYIENNKQTKLHILKVDENNMPLKRS